LVDAFVQHHHHVQVPQPTPQTYQQNLSVESLELISVLIKINTLSIFEGLLPAEALQCQIFWQSLFLFTPKQVSDELKMVIDSSEVPIKSLGGVVITYKQINQTLKRARNLKSAPFQPPILPAFNMMGVLPNF
jgi:hypothetical protein